MQPFIFSVAKEDHHDKSDEEKNGEDELSRCEHIFIFRQK